MNGKIHHLVLVKNYVFSDETEITCIASGTAAYVRDQYETITEAVEECVRENTDYFMYRGFTVDSGESCTFWTSYDDEVTIMTADEESLNEFMESDSFTLVDSIKGVL